MGHKRIICCLSVFTLHRPGKRAPHQQSGCCPNSAPLIVLSSIHVQTRDYLVALE